MALQPGSWSLAAAPEPNFETKLQAPVQWPCSYGKWPLLQLHCMSTKKLRCQGTHTMALQPEGWSLVAAPEPTGQFIA